MRPMLVCLLAVVALAAGCGGGQPAEEPEAEPVRTFADDTIGAKDKARERTEQAVESHMQALQQRLDADEDAPAESTAEPAAEPAE